MVELSDGVLVVDCVEYEHIEINTELWLNEAHQIVLNSEIDGRDILRANFRQGVLRLQATSYVGVIPLNERVVLRVKPRVPLANLTRMVVETGHDVLALSAIREYSGQGAADDWAMDLYANALIDRVDELLDFGLQREYRRREGEGRFPHGRIEFNRTMQRFAARGIPNKAAHSWHERTVDTALNRCVRAAMETVHAYLTKARSSPRRGDRGRLARLAGQLLAFQEVEHDTDYRFLDDRQVLGLTPLPDSRAYYRSILDLSVLILRGKGIALDVDGNDVSLGSLLIDTNKLFENFVRVSLSKHARRLGWPVDVLDGNTVGKVDLYDIPDPLPAPLGVPMSALALRDRGKAQPDVVFRLADGTVPLIAEVKNTIHGKHADALPDRDEVEQAVTYALRYGLPHALLVHPWIKGTKGLAYVGRVRSIDVYDYRLDLSSETLMNDSLAAMAETLYRLAGLPIQIPTSD